MLKTVVNVGVGRYFQGVGILKNIGKEIGSCSSKTFIVGGEETFNASFDRIKTSLEKERIDYNIWVFSGDCSENNIGHIKENAIKYNPDVIVAVGGGRCIDTY